MKLTSRQKKIILTFIISLIFSVTLISVSVFLFSKNSKSQQNSPSFEDNKNEIIKEIEQKFSSNNIKESDLLQKLKDSQYLAVGESDWKKYFDSARTSQELEERKKQILTIIDNLVETGSSGSSGSSGQFSNKWEKAFWEIKNFLDANPASLQELRNFVEKYPKPLAEINLAGVDASKLKKKSSSEKIKQVDIEKLRQEIIDKKNLCVGGHEGGRFCPDVSDCQVLKESAFREFDGSSLVKFYNRFRDWNLAESLGDGNCFFNSFAVFLTGHSDKDVAEQLRVAAVLETIKNDEFLIGKNDDGAKIKEIKRLILDVFNIGRKETDGAKKNWASDEACNVLSRVLKRKIIAGRVATSWVDENDNIYKEDLPLYFFEFDPPNKQFSEEWVVYNSSGHFEPLIP